MFHQTRSSRQEDAQECQAPGSQAKLGDSLQRSHNLVNTAQNSTLIKTLPTRSKRSQTRISNTHTGSLRAHIPKLYAQPNKL